MTAEWIDRMRRVPVLTIAEALGIEFQPPRGSSGGALPCPACNALRRHTKTRDKRAAAGVRHDGQGWRCFQCDASGDGIDLVALHLRGKRLPELGDTGKAEVRDWCMNWLGIAPTAASAVQRPPGQTKHLAPPSLPTARHYPPGDEVNALWTTARPVTEVQAISSWLAADRGLDPKAIAELDLARVVLDDSLTTLPRWAGFGGSDDKPWRSWPSAGLRLLVPLCDASGAMRSVLFRRAFETTRDWPPKSIGTNGFERAGLVMANAVALHLLTHPPDTDAPVSVVIEEGETDWLTACLAWARRNERAIFGVTTGSWTEEIAKCVPSGARVTIRTDNDQPGDLLAVKIASTFAGRCTVLRGGRKAKGSGSKGRQ